MVDIDKNINNANTEILSWSNNVNNFVDVIDTETSNFFNLGNKKSPIKMLINNREFTEFNSLRISYSIDSACSAFSFDTIFYPGKGTSNTIAPFQYEEIKIIYNNKTIMNGYIEKIVTAYSNDGSKINIQGRSKSGILIDTDLNKKMYYNVSIKEIALDNSFLFIKNDPIVIYRTVEIDSGENAFSKFSKLALDRGMYAIPNYDGSLLFADITRLTNLNYTIEDGDQNVLGISASYDITTRFAKYIGFDKNSSVTINDISIDNRRGQKYIRTNDITSDKTKIAKMARSKNIANSFTMAVSLSTWELNKNLLQPGMLINVNSPMNMIYQKSEFVIKQIDYTYDINNGYICEIQLTLPEAYTNNEPNPRFFGTYEEKDTSLFTKFTKIPDSKDVYDSARKIKL